MPLPYRQVSDIYDQLKTAGVVTQSLPEWSQHMADLTGTDTYNEGMHDNVVRRASVGLDKLIESTGLPDATGAFGRAIGDVFDKGDVGEAAGRAIPRGLVDFAPLAAAPFTGGTSLAALPALGAGALSGLHSYADTGSVAAGVTSGIVGAALPGITEAATQGALGQLGARYLGEATTGADGVVSTLNKYLPQSVGLPQRLAAEAAGQVAAVGTMGAGDVARQALDPNEQVSNPFTGDFALSTALQTLPFTALHAAKSLTGAHPAYDTAALDRNIAMTRVTLEDAAVKQQAETAAPVTADPTYDYNAFAPEEQAKVDSANDMLTKMQERSDKVVDLRSQIASDDGTDPDALAEKHAELAATQQEQFDATGGKGILDGQAIDPTPETTHVPIVGTDYTPGNNGKSATFTVADHPTNEDSGYVPDDRVNYSTVFQHKGPPVDNGDGTHTVQVPVGYHQPVEDFKAKVKAIAGPTTPVDPALPAEVPGQPTLPQAQTETDVDKVQEINAKLVSAKEKLTQAVATGDPDALHQAKLTFRDAQVDAGHKPWDDSDFAEWHKMLNDKAEAEKVTQTQATAGAMDALMNRVTQKALLELQRKQALAELKDKVAATLPGATEFAGQPIDALHKGLTTRLAKAFNPDLIWKAVDKWDKEGRKVPVADLFATIDEQQGRTKVKPKDLPLTLAADQPLASTQHARDLMGNMAQLVLEKHAMDNGLTDEQIADGQRWAQAHAEGDVVPTDVAVQPHVQEMQDELNAYLKRASVRAPRPAGPPTPAGDKWVWGLTDFDPVTDQLGGKKLASIGAKDGVMPESRFLNMAGRGKPLNSTELELGKIVVPDAFDGKGNVDVRKLYAGLKEKGPVVETKTLGTEPTNPTIQRGREIEHQLDTINPNWKFMEPEEIVAQHPEAKDLLEEYDNLSRPTSDAAGKTQYSFLGPKSESDMPGYVEGLVRLPKTDKEQEFERQVAIANNQFHPDRTQANEYLDEARKTRAVYKGPHFGTEDKNVLAFYRGYEETLPDGTKAFHVIETQSDWGQGRRKAEAESEKFRPTIKDVNDLPSGWSIRNRDDFEYTLIGADGIPKSPTARTPEEALTKYNDAKEKLTTVQNHPLLKDDVWKTLALKAAIAHAREVGATKIILSDGETAMMTEGHDKAAETNYTFDPTTAAKLGRQNPIVGDWALETPEGKLYVRSSKEQAEDQAKLKGEKYKVRQVTETDLQKQVSQSAGMRLHYDSALPSAMKKLTGDAGQKVELGTHEKGTPGSYTVTNEQGTEVGRYTTQQEAQAKVDAAGPRRQLTIQETQAPGSLVFRNPDGTPKSSISGRIYPLGEAFRRQDEQGGGSTLGDPTRAPREPQPYVPQTADEAATVQALGLSGDATAAMSALSRDQTFGGLARDLATRFPNALRRIKMNLVDDMSSSSAQLMPDGSTTLHLSRALLGMDPVTRNFEVMHELVHGLTEGALHDPANAAIVAKLENLRQRLIEALPTTERQRFNELQASNWYERWQRQDPTTSFSDLSDDPRVAMKLYGLLTKNELLAQGFSSHDMRHFMQSMKGEAGVSGWSKFKNFVRDILGLGEKVNGTAFDEFLNHSSRLMDAGEQTAQTHEFLSSWYRQQGVGDVVAQRQTTRALGVLQATGWDGTRDGIAATLYHSPGALDAQTSALNAMLTERGPDAGTATSIMSELGVPPTQAGVDNLVYDMTVGGTHSADAMMFLPPAVTDYVYAKLADYQQVIDGVAGAIAPANEKLVGVARPEEIRGPVSEMQNALASALRAQQVQKASVATLTNMQGMMPDVFAQRAMAPRLGKAQEELLTQDKPSLTHFQKWFTQLGRVAKSDPVIAELANHMFSLVPNARQMEGDSLRVLGYDMKDLTSGLTDKGVTASAKPLSNVKIQRAHDSWIAADQKVALDEERGVTMLPDSHLEVQKALAGLTQAERNDVIDLRAKSVAANQAHNKQILNKAAQIGVTRAANIVTADTKLKSSDAVRMSKQLWDAVTKSEGPTDPAAQAAIAAVQSRMTPDGFLQLVQMTQNNKMMFDKLSENMEKNPAWASAQRQQKFLVHYTVGGKSKLGQADSMDGAKAFVKRLGGTFSRLEVNQKGSGEDFPDLGGDAGGITQEIARLEQTQLSYLKDKMSPDDFALLQANSLSQQFARNAGNQGSQIPETLTPPRRLNQGAEALPWFRNQLGYIRRSSTYWSRALLRAQADLHLNSSEMLGNDNVRQFMKTAVDNQLRGDPKTIQKINHLTSTWFMGFAPATAMSNGLQTLSTLAPELTRMNGGKIVDSYRRWSNAIREVSTSRSGWKTPERAQFIKEATRAGEIDYSQYDPDQIARETVSAKLLQVMDGNEPQSLAQRASSKAGAFSNAAFMFFRPVEKFNHYVTLISAFDLARDQGQTYAQAKQTAFETNRAVNYGGGRAQRPVAPFSGTDAFSRSAAMLATNMQNYNLGVMGQLGQYLREGLFRPPGLKPGEIFAARKAALQMVGTQLAAAGVLGLPFVAGGLAVLNKLFPGAELGRHLRESMSGFLDDDKDHNGSAWSDIALTGLPSMLGWDMQSRLSMGSLVPGIDENNGFQPEALLGAPYSLMSNFVSGAARLSSGDVRGAQSFLPPAVKKMFQLVTNDGTVRNSRGGLLITPTPGEKVGIALGYNPKRASDMNAADRMLGDAARLANQREGQFRQEQAGDAIKGNFGSVRQALLQRKSEDPTFDPTAAIRGIADAAEDLTFPRDLRQQGNVATSASRQRLLTSFGVASPNVGEAQRLMFKQQLMQRLGLPTALTPESLRSAQLVDSLRAQSPTATRAQLRLQARTLTHGQRAQPELAEVQ